MARMAEDNEGAWVVRAGRGAAYVDDCVEGGYVGLGYGEALGELPDQPTREDLAARFRASHPTWKDGKVHNATGQLYRFLVEMSEGDLVITVDSSRRLYIIGSIASAPFRKDDSDLPIRRRVEWTHVASRDSLSVSTRNTLGSTLSLFRLPAEAVDDLRAQQRPFDQADEGPVSRPPPKPAPPDEDAGTLEDLLGEIQQKSQEFIEDRIAALDPDEMEQLVAGILRAMGYKTEVSDKGPDRGVDVFASPDGLGLQEPRIFVEVKHRVARMGSQELRSFLGGRQQGDRCLYVSTGGFTREARYEAERANVPLTLIDLPRLRRLLLEHYDSVDLETKQLVPLTRVYWPLEEDG
jgi:restriction system protein